MHGFRQWDDFGRLTNWLAESGICTCTAHSENKNVEWSDRTESESDECKSRNTNDSIV